MFIYICIDNFRRNFYHPSYRVDTAVETFIYSAFINVITMGDTDTECMRMFFLIFAFNILKEIFFFFPRFHDTITNTTCQWHKYIRLFWFTCIVFNIFILNNARICFFNIVFVFTKRSSTTNVDCNNRSSRSCWYLLSNK